MCGIAGAAGEDSESLVRRMLEVIKHRGPDGSGICTIGSMTLGNVLLKITGDKNQPISNGGVLTYNGEIYNFKYIAKRLNLETKSDSEALYALIGSKGIEPAIRELDGDYAFAYMTDQKLHIVRDPVGVKPLYYSHEGASFAFASEKKSLAAIGMNPMTLKPGHLISITDAGIKQKKVTVFVTGERIIDEDRASKALFDSIENSIRKRKYQPCGIAFSGGLDSSLIAALSCDSKLFCACMEGSHDIQQTKKAAKLLGLEDSLCLHELTIDEVESSIPYVIKAIESAEPMMVGIAMPLFFASRDAHKDGIRVMLSGQGADELLGGYKRYESMKPDELESALWTDFENIAQNNLERDDAVTMANSVELRLPYLDRDVVGLALRIDAGLKVHKGIRKYILRKAAANVLPHDLAWKEKKAAQYSSGIYSALERIAKNNGYRGKGYLGRYLKDTGKGLGIDEDIS